MPLLTICIQKQQDAHNSLIRLYFPLDALHVSDYISPSSGATFVGCTSHLVYAGIYFNSFWSENINILFQSFSFHLPYN